MLSKITSKYQTTIPKKIRQRLKLKVSDNISWEIEGDSILVKPTHNPFLSHYGTVIIGSGNTVEDVRKIRDIISRKYK